MATYSYSRASGKLTDELTFLIGVTQLGLFEERKMPWKACNPMDERLKFIARLDGEKMAGLCREFSKSGFMRPQTLEMSGS